MVRRRRSSAVSPRLGLELAERVDGEARRELAGPRAAHAVGDHEQGRLIEERVLVRAPHLAGVARARVIDDAHGRYSSYLSSVSPTRTSSPTRRRCSATSACPATCVPFVEPEVLDVARAVAHHDARVMAGDVLVAVEHHLVVGIAAKPHVPSETNERARRIDRAREHDQPRVGRRRAAAQPVRGRRAPPRQRRAPSTPAARAGRAPRGARRARRTGTGRPRRSP